ncbi:MAG: hypothetical protein CMG71_02030 [Candidatus Marinimicrobia bacterium]|nr:hypothetical protein [Candidatus Neomarinimicrobiota bacterium]
MFRISILAGVFILVLPPVNGSAKQMDGIHTKSVKGGNSRLQIFEQDGNHISTWTQFGRPSGLYIDANDVLYSADSESNATWGNNPGWKRGIRIGSAVDGWVTALIPDPDNASTTGAEGVAADAYGNIYGAELGPQMLRKYVKR